MTPGICNAPRAYLETLPFLALPLCLHVGKRGVSALLQGQLDAFYEQIERLNDFSKDIDRRRSERR
jgi:hypothetical protein